jgi:hypothetical protein
MGILVVAGVLFGMILGQFFKCFVLFPACGLAIVLVLASPAHMEHSLLGSFVQTVVLITSLQIGYVVGLVARDVRLAHKRSKAPGGRSLKEIPSSLPETSESGRRAA